MKQKFDALTDLVEHVQDATASEPNPSGNKRREVTNGPGEKIILDDNLYPDRF